MPYSFPRPPAYGSILIYLCFLILTLKENWQTSQPASNLPPSKKDPMENQSNILPYKKVALILHGEVLGCVTPSQPASNLPPSKKDPMENLRNISPYKKVA